MSHRRPRGTRAGPAAAARRRRRSAPTAEFPSFRVRMNRGHGKDSREIVTRGPKAALCYDFRRALRTVMPGSERQRQATTIRSEPPSPWAGQQFPSPTPGTAPMYQKRRFLIHARPCVQTYECVKIQTGGRVDVRAVRRRHRVDRISPGNVCAQAGGEVYAPPACN
jgi:hypothetical protein